MIKLVNQAASEASLKVTAKEEHSYKFGVKRWELFF